MVLSIEAKRKGDGIWEVFTDCGREASGLDVIDWAIKGVNLGAGEILLTSIDQEGTTKGFDLELTDAVAKAVNVPIIASGGYGKPNDFIEVVKVGADGVAFADALHYGKITFNNIRNFAKTLDIDVRDI